MDLEKCYKLTKVKLFWENAYATSFDIEISDDGENYTPVKSVTNAKGGVQEWDIRLNNEAVEAQFVRISCKTRNTGYGVSLWELEVYGEGLCQDIVTDVEHNVASQSLNRKFIKDGQLFISHNGMLFTVSGFVFMRQEER